MQTLLTDLMVLPPFFALNRSLHGIPLQLISVADPPENPSSRKLCDRLSNFFGSDWEVVMGKQGGRDQNC